MSVTNADEGAIFVDSSTAGTVQVPEYLMQLFPSLSAQHRDVVVTKYSGLGAPIDQVTAIMGECMYGTRTISFVSYSHFCSHIRLPHLLPTSSFQRKSIQGKLKVQQRSEDSDIKFNQGQFAIPPATHGMDVSFYFPSYVRGHNMFNCILISFQHECKWRSLLQ